MSLLDKHLLISYIARKVHVIYIYIYIYIYMCVCDYCLLNYLFKNVK